VNNTHVISDIHHMTNGANRTLARGFFELSTGVIHRHAHTGGYTNGYPHDIDHTTILRSSYPHDLHHKTQCPFCPTYWSV